jgi:hypothetical protein
MSLADMMAYFDIKEDNLDEALVGLVDKGLAKIIRDKRGIALAKATYEGLKEAFPLDHYKWFPEWIKEENIFEG